MQIDYKIKQQCVGMKNQGICNRQIYNDFFIKNHDGMSFETFRHKIVKWQEKITLDENILDSANLNYKFVPHNSTVQVDRQGNIIQAWIKQHTDESQQYDELIKTIKENVKPEPIQTINSTQSDRMLEIGLFDMHLGLDNDYSKTLSNVLEIISYHDYDEINIIVGQDLFHNDDFRGRTSKGTQIQKVDIKKAWKYATSFYSQIINASFEHTDTVKITYVKANHDESLSWAFTKQLEVMFPNAIIDDGLNRRKCIYWKGCFIGLTHGCETMSKNNDLRGQFTIKFPEQFAKAQVREIHCGHLHHEKEADVYGVMIRRLSTANIEDDWSDDSGFVGAHKRFMIFEWEPNRLKDIHYV